MSLVHAPSFVRLRTALMRWDTGLTSVKARSQLGRVSTGTNAFERNVSGNRMRNEIPWTLEALRATTPKKAKIQLSAHAQTMTRIPLATTSPNPPPGRHPMMKPTTNVIVVAMA
jgi:hypothetical protein